MVRAWRPATRSTSRTICPRFSSGTTNVFTYGLNDLFSRKIPIFWGGNVETKYGFTLDYQRNVFHTKKVLQHVNALIRTNYITVNGVGGTRYVSLAGGNVWPYTSWTSAATNIQDAINACSDWDTVLVNKNDAGESINILTDSTYAQKQHSIVDTILISDARNLGIGPMV